MHRIRRRWTRRVLALVAAVSALGFQFAPYDNAAERVDHLVAGALLGLAFLVPAALLGWAFLPRRGMRAMLLLGSGAGTVVALAPLVTRASLLSPGQAMIVAAIVGGLGLLLAAQESVRAVWCDKEGLRDVGMRGRRAQVPFAKVTEARAQFFRVIRDGSDRRGEEVAQVTFISPAGRVHLSTVIDDVTAAELRSLIRRCNAAVVGRALGADL